MSVDGSGRGRIVHVIDGLGHGGAERLLTLILSGLADAGYDVLAITLQEKGGNPEAERMARNGIAVEYLPVDRLRRVDQIIAALKRLRRIRPDVIHAHLQFSSILAGIARRTLGVPAVVTLHTDEDPGGLDRAGLRVRLTDAVLSRWVDRVICLTDASKRSAIERGVKDRPLTVLPNGIDLSSYLGASRDTGARIRRDLGLADDDIVLMAIAVLRPEKGLDRLVSAFAQLAPGSPRLRLVIVGDGAQREALGQQVSAAGLGGRVIMTGYRTDISDLLSAADIFVTPTLADVLPTVVIEAMASGLPVIASRVGGLPEMIRDGREGRLVPPDDIPALAGAISETVGDDEGRLAMGARARDRAVREYSLETQIERLSRLYDDLMGTGASR